MCRLGDFKWFTLNGVEYFHDMKNDPYELRNFIADSAYKTKIREVKERHAKYMRETQIDFAAGTPPMVERLRREAQHKK